MIRQLPSFVPIVKYLMLAQRQITVSIFLCESYCSAKTNMTNKNNLDCT